MRGSRCGIPFHNTLRLSLSSLSRRSAAVFRAINLSPVDISHSALTLRHIRALQPVIRRRFARDRAHHPIHRWSQDLASLSQCRPRARQRVPFVAPLCYHRSTRVLVNSTRYALVSPLQTARATIDRCRRAAQRASARMRRARSQSSSQRRHALVTTATTATIPAMTTANLAVPVPQDETDVASAHDAQLVTATAQGCLQVP